MTTKQSAEIIASLRQRAEQAADESGVKGDSRYSFLLGFLQNAFENELQKMVYESSNDN